VDHSTVTNTSRVDKRLAKNPAPVFCGCSMGLSRDAKRHSYVTCTLSARPIRGLVGMALIFGITFAAIADAAECLAPTKQNQLQSISECTNAMCCPRDLNLQINLVRAVAGKLKAKNYAISDSEAPPEESPDLSGMRNKALLSAIRQYKLDQKIADGSADITYELVATLLGVNLFERWR
jgi:hypothetical protein